MSTVDQKALAIQPDSQPSLMQMIAQMASDERVNTEKMQALIGMKERLEAREAEAEFHRAFAVVSGLLPRIKKNGTIDMGAKGKIPFAKYEDLDRIVKPIEAAHGFIRSFSSDLMPNGVLMIIALGHSGGHSVTSRMQLPPDPGPGRNALQAMGSSRSYGKRYLTIDIWNIVTEGADDDGVGSSAIGEREIRQIEDLLAACDLMTPEQIAPFLKWASVRRIAEIQMVNYPAAVNQLEQKLRRTQGK